MRSRSAQTTVTFKPPVTTASVGCWANIEVVQEEPPPPVQKHDISTQTIKEVPVVWNLYGSPQKIVHDHGYARSIQIDAIDSAPAENTETMSEEEANTTECDSECEDDVDDDPNWEPINGPGIVGCEVEIEESYDDVEDEQEVFSHADATPVTDRKYLVFQKQLEELLNFCPKCGAPVLERTSTIKGSLLTVQLSCGQSHFIKWRSQPIQNYYPMGNVLLSAACLFAGSTYTRLYQVFKFLGLQVPRPGTFFKHQRDILFPVIAGAWRKKKHDILQELAAQNREITLIGDGRCDSPGFSAKYGTYTVMDSVTSKIVELEVVQVTEVNKYFVYNVHLLS